MTSRTQGTEHIASLSIDSVVDSQGAPVSEGELTRDPELTLSGTTVDTQLLQIMDNGDPGGATLPQDSKWTGSLILRRAGNHSFTVRSIATGEESEPWVIDASWNEPVIESVVDSQNAPVGDGEFTRDSELTFSGTSVETQIVQIMDNGLIGINVWPVNDRWTGTISLSRAGRHSFTAQSIDNGAESEPWVIDASWDEPVITGVTDSQGVSVPSGSSTHDTQLTFTGTVVDLTTPDFLDIQDNGLLVARAFTFNGGWEAQLRGLVLGSHSFTAQSNNTGAVSEPWVVTVTNSTP